jgi:hypothetical protein
MGIRPHQLFGIWTTVNNGYHLLRPIFAEVDSDGRLVRADDAIFKLHKRAGGVQGGMFAIPALAALGQLAIRLQMRLSRAVRVADEAERVELWVEVFPEAKLAKLSITSWQGVPSVPKSIHVENDGNVSVNAGTMKLDTALRLLRAGGMAVQGLTPHDFGRDGRDILRIQFEADDNLAMLIDAITEGVGISPRRLNRIFDNQSVAVAGHAHSGGYDLAFEAAPDFFRTDGIATDAPDVMFGKHLAPALRQPLGRIIANAETIGSELQGPIRENYAQYARDIANAARHLSALVDDLGDLEAIERPGFTTARDHIELGDVARRVAGLLALKAADHSIRLLVPAESENVAAVAEFRRTLQIMLNLVINAVRYAPDGTDIRIEIGRHDDFALISVSDQGVGIAGEDSEKIFEKFERLGRSGDGGSGLGLYISRRLAQAMGGDLSVSVAESGGAKFTLRLPIE